MRVGDQDSFYIITGDQLDSCVIVSAFLERFGDDPRFLGVLITEPPVAEEVRAAREVFHAEHAGVTTWTEALDQRWEALYPPLHDAGRALVARYGLPRHGSTSHPNTIFLGAKLNTPENQRWFTETHPDTPPWLMVYVPKLLSSWWITATQGRVLNCHSAVLPFARGLSAVENVAATRDIEAFRRAAGVTVHYIDSGVDTGAIVRAQRVRDPFRFDSIWDLKAHLYYQGIRAFAEVTEDILRTPDMRPVGVTQHPDLVGPNYRRRDFTPARRQQAIEGYLAMKARVYDDR